MSAWTGDTADPASVDLTPVAGGIAAVAGVAAAGVAAGLRSDGRSDLALVDVGRRVPVAVTVTTNQVRAAPCEVTLAHAADGRARAVVINSGNANACTGDEGLRASVASASAVADALGCATDDVLVLSTGVIGVPLALDTLIGAVPALVADLATGRDAGDRAARAIMTTDSVDKQSAVRLTTSDGEVSVGGMAKGAGMIEPAMATMLAVLVTDAHAEPDVLARVLRTSVERTFNRISVDGCGSTNDTVVLLATGSSGVAVGEDGLTRAVQHVCAALAEAIVDDGEGTGKTCTIRVAGAPDEDSALVWARAVAGSTLFRAALHGADPNWGRILAAMGTTSVRFDPRRVGVRVGDVEVCRDGMAVPFDRSAAADRMVGPRVTIDIDVSAGPSEASVLCADLTPEYVAANAYYTT